MSNNLGNKKVMAENIKRYMTDKNVNATDVCNALDFPQATFSDWIHARTYPRIDKIEKMSNYFGITKPDLIEPKAEQFSNEVGELSEDESKLVLLFRSVPESRRSMVFSYIELAADEQK